MLPRSIALSKVASDKLRAMKASTGLTPNILARIAIMLAIEDGTSLANSSVGDADGQVLSKDVLFGEHVEIYEVLINQFKHDTNNECSLAEIISSLIEAGVHKMGHVKALTDLVNLGR